MPRAIANPEEIRKFAYVLTQCINRLRDLRTELMSRFGDLDSHWRDEKYAHFREAFTAKMHLLDVFLEQGEGYVQYLHRKVQPLDEYLKHRY
jgi:hypothetical protein